MGPTRTHWCLARQLTEGSALVRAAENGQLEAVYNGEVEAAALLLDRAASPDKPCSLGCTPLIAAAMIGHVAMVGLLLERDADPNATNPDGNMAFHFACATNRPGCVEALARAGCDTAAKTKFGQTGKQVAEENGHTDVLDCLARMAKKAAKNKKKRERKRRQTAQPVRQSGVAQPV